MRVIYRNWSNSLQEHHTLIALWAIPPVPNFTFYLKSEVCGISTGAIIRYIYMFCFQKVSERICFFVFLETTHMLDLWNLPFFSVSLMAGSVFLTSVSWLFCLLPFQNHLWLSGYTGMIPEDLPVLRSTVSNLNSIFHLHSPLSLVTSGNLFTGSADGGGSIFEEGHCSSGQINLLKLHCERISK